MIFIKNHKIILTLFGILFVNIVSAKVVEFVEDPYTMQAPKEIVNIADKIALLMEFKDGYEIVVPKKAGIQINPWNKFITQGINPQTKNPFIIVNPQWFLSIPQDQQAFLLGRFFLTFKNGVIPLNMKIVPYMFVFFTFFLIFLLVWALGKTRLANHKKWIRFLIAFSVVAACNIIFVNKLQIRLLQYLSFRHDFKINEMVSQKTLDKASAIKALEFVDSSIKSESEKGETFFTPYVSLFKKYADELKK